MSRRHSADEILRIKHQIRERDGMRCTRCKMTNDEHLERFGNSLHVHRLKPGSYYTPEGCITVCIPCHGPQAKRKKGEPDLEATQIVRFVHLRPDIHQQLVELAEENNRPLSWQIQQILIEALKAAGKWPPPKSEA